MMDDVSVGNISLTRDAGNESGRRYQVVGGQMC